MTGCIVSASILSANFEHLAQDIRQAEDAGADWIHIDVMDGQFVPNITMGPFVIETCRRITRLPLDVHLMIVQPEHHIDAFIEAGANWLSVHVEGNPNIHRTLQAIRASGCHPSIVLNPGTPASSLSAILPFVDMVLVMTVNPGYGGQQFIPESLSKITEIQEMINRTGRDIILEVDGGIDEQTAPMNFKAGARAFVAGTSIFRHPNGIRTGIQALKNACDD